MAASEDKNKRKAPLAEISARERKDFERSLPVSKQIFQDLFDFLDEKLVECDDSLTLTHAFLVDNCINNISEVKTWLQEHGGYCDASCLRMLKNNLNRVRKLSSQPPATICQ